MITSSIHFVNNRDIWMTTLDKEVTPAVYAHHSLGGLPQAGDSVAGVRSIVREALEPLLCGKRKLGGQQKNYINLILCKIMI